MSFKSEVIADSTGEWCSNGLAFATKEEADAYGMDLSGRWMAVQKIRTVESKEPVNYSFSGGKLAAVEGPDFNNEVNLHADTVAERHDNKEA